jgi:integrase
MPVKDPNFRPRYRLHRPSGLAVVSLSGRDHYLGRHGTPESRAEYDRLVAEWLANGRRSVGSRDDPTINELMVPYINHVDAYYVKDGRQTSEPGNIRLSLRTLRRLYGHTLAKDFGPLALKAVRGAYIEEGLCRTEVNRRTGHIVRFFKWATENEYVPPSVHHGLRAVSGLRKGRSDVRESEPVKPVPDHFVDALRPHIKPVIWAMIALQRLSGMRPGEVCQMRSCDIDTSGRIWAYRPESHKTEHHDLERVVYLGPRSQNILRSWLKTDLTAYIFSPRESEDVRLAERRMRRQTPFRPSQRGRREPAKDRKIADRYDTRSYYHAIRRACDKANVPRWGPGRLRHNAATMIRKEFGLDVARTVLGHSSPAVTAVYAESDWAKAAEAMGQIG